MALITRNHVEQTLSTITSEQINRCSLITDCQTGKNFYLVLSQTDNETEYKVTYSPSKQFQCTCKAGQNGRLCWHVRAAVAHVKERKAAEVKEQQIASALLSLQTSESALRGRGLSQTDVEILQQHISQARSDLATLGYKLPTVAEKWNIPAWMMRDPGPRVRNEYA